MTEVPDSHSTRIKALRESTQLNSAFLAAGSVSLALYSVHVLFLLGRDMEAPILVNSLSDLVMLLFFILIVMLIGFLPVFLAVGFIAYPIFLMLTRFRILNTVSILVSAYLTGLIAARFWMVVVDLARNEPAEYRLEWNDFLDIVLPAGVCALIGGLVFCWMTIWRKPVENGMSDAPQ